MFVFRRVKNVYIGLKASINVEVSLIPLCHSPDDAVDRRNSSQTKYNVIKGTTQKPDINVIKQTPILVTNGSNQNRRRKNEVI